jgi:hypothetical protein
MMSSLKAPAGVQRNARPRLRRIGTMLLIFCASAGAAVCLLGAAPGARVKAAGAPAAQGAGAPAAGDTTTFTPHPDATLLQVMRGVMFPESNVVFAGQMDVSKIPLAPQPALSPNLLTSVFGGWPAVENSALALAETANTLMVPGRMCANGKPVPVTEAAWVKYVTGMRAAALDTYKVAQTKNTDDMVDAAGVLSDSCMACHNVYRSNRTGMAGRCVAAPPAPPKQ